MLQVLAYNKEKKGVKLETAERIGRLLKDSRNLLWIDIVNPSEDDIDVMVEIFKFHQLAIEDAIFPQNQPKLDEYDDYLFIVVHGMDYSHVREQAFQTRELNIFFGKNYVLTIHNDPLAPVSKLFRRCPSKSQAMQQGAGFLLHAIIDNIVDGYFPVVEKLENRIEELEDRVLEGADKSVLENIVKLKRTVMTLRNFMLPQQKILGLLGRSSTPFIRPATAAYFRDVYDHVVQVNSMLDTYRDVLNSTMEAYLSVVSNRMNEIMKTLTIITTIMMPLTVITSFYGMNIKLPEFAWGWKGYFFVLGLMGIAMTGMLMFLKRKKWI